MIWCGTQESIQDGWTFLTYEQGNGLIQFDPQTNTCTVWDTTNSEIPAHTIPAISIQGTDIYFTCVDKFYPDYPDNNAAQREMLLKLSNGSLSLLNTAENYSPQIRNLRAWPSGSATYAQFGFYDYEDYYTLYKNSSANPLETGTELDFEYGDVYERDASKRYVFGTTRWIEYYNGSPVEAHTHPFISKNGIVIIEEETRGGLPENTDILSLFQFPTEDDKVWFGTNHGLFRIQTE